MDWEKQRQIFAEVTRGPWAEWVSTARKPKDIVLKEAEDRLGRRLGLPTVPKDGLCSIGWVIQMLAGGYNGHGFPDANDPYVRLVSLLSTRGDRGEVRVGSTAQLVYNLMCHREFITKHGHNSFHNYRQRESIRLYDGHWHVLDEEILTWLKLQSPFGQVDRLDDDYLQAVCLRERRLHNPEGPAVVTVKGRTLYALNGVTMTREEYALRRNARAILAVNNLEVRRVLIEDMGPEEFIRQAGLTPIHRDETGQLYRLESTAGSEWERDRTHLCWVHVTCPSTDRQYMLAVPPRTRTAREGVAWTFRKLPEEYQPGVQT